MKALSLLPEWAHFVWTGEKTIECRSWKTDYRGDILICASSRKLKGFVSGYAMVVVELLDIVPFQKKHLQAAMMEEMPDIPCYAWILGDTKEIIPFEQKGKLHLFDVKDEKIQYLYAKTDEEAEANFEKYFKPLYEAAGMCFDEQQVKR